MKANLPPEEGTGWHYLFDHSSDMEYLEIVGPADFTTVDVEGPCPISPPTPWKQAPAY